MATNDELTANVLALTNEASQLSQSVQALYLKATQAEARANAALDSNQDALGQTGALTTRVTAAESSLSANSAAIANNCAKCTQLGNLYLFISKSGNDSNDGLNAERPVATLNKAWQIANKLRPAYGSVIFCFGAGNWGDINLTAKGYYYTITNYSNSGNSYSADLPVFGNITIDHGANVCLADLVCNSVMARFASDVYLSRYLKLKSLACLYAARMGLGGNLALEVYGSESKPEVIGLGLGAILYCDGNVSLKVLENQTLTAGWLNATGASYARNIGRVTVTLASGVTVTGRKYNLSEHSVTNNSLAQLNALPGNLEGVWENSLNQISDKLNNDCRLCSQNGNKQIYLSKSGNDNNDGSSDAKPVATLNRALKIAAQNMPYAGTVVFHFGAGNWGDLRISLPHGFIITNYSGAASAYSDDLPVFGQVIVEGSNNVNIGNIVCDELLSRFHAHIYAYGYLRVKTIGSAYCGKIGFANDTLLEIVGTESKNAALYAGFGSVLYWNGDINCNILENQTVTDAFVSIGQGAILRGITRCSFSLASGVSVTGKKYGLYEGASASNTKAQLDALPGSLPGDWTKSINGLEARLAALENS